MQQQAMQLADLVAVFKLQSATMGRNPAPLARPELKYAGKLQIA